jgi:acetyl-CoA carboxylase carboxyl transferase beta subunit
VPPAAREDLETSGSSPATCPACSAPTEGTAWHRYRVCGHCRYHFQLTASERIELLADPDSFKPSNPTLVSVDPLVFTDRVSYRDRLERARRETNLNEAVITGTARINGRDCVLAVFDFNFLGGSMGSVVGEKVALALELAAERRHPFISVVSSGGARMQEGMLSLVQMGKTTAAAMRLHQAGVPSITVLTNPTTGGVYASFASQGDFLLAEPGALIGFAGPRVIEQHCCSCFWHADQPRFAALASRIVHRAYHLPLLGRRYSWRAATTDRRQPITSVDSCHSLWSSAATGSTATTQP